MRNNLLKAIFYILFYLAMAYISLCFSLRIDDYLKDFKTVNNFDEANEIVLSGVHLITVLLPVLFLALAASVVKSYFDQKKGNF